MPFALLSSHVPTTVGLPLGNEADPYAPAVARLVKAIVQYSRWPSAPRTLRACVVGPADHAEDLLAGREVRAMGVIALPATPDGVGRPGVRSFTWGASRWSSSAPSPIECAERRC